MPSSLVNLGLDLRGGAQLLAEVRVEDVYAHRMDALWPEVRDVLRDERDAVGAIRRIEAPDGAVAGAHRQPRRHGRGARRGERAGLATSSASPAIGSKDIDVAGEGDIITVQLSEAEQARHRRPHDPAIARDHPPPGRRGRHPRTVDHPPGRAADPDPGAGPRLGRRAEGADRHHRAAHLPAGGEPHDRCQRPSPGARQELLPSLDEEGVYYILEQTPVVTGEELTNAQPSFDQNGRPAVSFQFNVSGARKFGEYTAANVGAPFAIVLDDEVISAPRINEPIPGGSGIITGNFTVEDSTELAILLRAGALPAEMTFLEERTIGPELGPDCIDAGKIASIVAFAGGAGVHGAQLRLVRDHRQRGADPQRRHWSSGCCRPSGRR